MGANLPKRIESEVVENYCQAYVRCLDVKRAKELSGYTGSTSLLPIKTRIRELFNEVYERLDLVPTRTIAEIAKIALFDPAQLYDEDGSLLPMRKIPRNARAAIQAIEEVTHYDRKTGEPVRKVVKYKIASKIDALEMLAKTQGLLSTARGPQGGAQAENDKQEPVVFNLVMGSGDTVTISSGEKPKEVEVKGERID